MKKILITQEKNNVGVHIENIDLKNLHKDQILWYFEKILNRYLVSGKEA